eukprot:CAMPEP_0114225294 /NCGR_PEP_ID=MMETSP0058-20121206/584_1 /TAXON_ID=36894 /ORGANISM="Pyramimonas parkeae, CCMP726" /LENGTH=457 /DNA_ID=CAMNT_0001335867 /DNA_START=258 /DNA_END=1631 /DNA_ORIENTATION=+
MHVALKAALCNGCVVVDATRSSTKRFPDSMSKTIPIWAAVLNRAVYRHRRRNQLCTSMSTDSEQHWDTSVRLPLWVGDSEREEISSRLDQWVDALEAVGVDVSGLAKVMKKPLRPMWLSQQTIIWTNRIKPPESQPFYPIMLLSASAPLKGPQRGLSQLGGYSWTYVPGAGDDEETWSGGLTPAMFWSEHNHETLLAASPTECQGLVAEVVKREKNKMQSEQQQVASSTTRDEFEQDVPTKSPFPKKKTAEVSASERNDVHHPPPSGCVSYEGAVEPFEDGSLRWIGNTRLAVGKSTSKLLWAEADAAVYCGETPLDVPTEYRHRYFHARCGTAKSDKFGFERVLPDILSFASKRLAEDDKLLVCCEDGLERSVCAAVAILLCHFDPSGSEFRKECLPPSGMSKEDVRQRLRLVSSFHPHARPTRGMLRQVFNFCRGLLPDTMNTEDNIQDNSLRFA